VAGSLTTHVLDLAYGRPAAGVSIEIWRLDPDDRRTFLGMTETDSSGRAHCPLDADTGLEPGQYELVFRVGSYLAGQRPGVEASSFLDTVPVRFSVTAENGHYHVPFLFTPWAYTVYRGR